MNWRPLSSKELQAAEHYVRLAMDQAELAARTGNAPFGAVIVDALGDVVAAEHNRVREALDPSAHAEINAIRVACRRMGMPTLEGYRLYINKEPCPMCLVCAIEAKLSAVYYGEPDDGSVPVALPGAEIVRRAVDHRIRLHGGILAEEARHHREALLRRYSSGYS
jgi:tRNA(adenine34) deaminase